MHTGKSEFFCSVPHHEHDEMDVCISSELGAAPEAVIVEISPRDIKGFRTSENTRIYVTLEALEEVLQSARRFHRAQQLMAGITE